MVRFRITCPAWKASKYGVFSGPYFPVFNPNTGKCGPEISLSQYQITKSTVSVTQIKNLTRILTLSVLMKRSGTRSIVNTPF